MIPTGDITELRAAFAANPSDLGVGLYNVVTGEIRLGSFDRVTKRQGHQGLADALGITDNHEWRGFVLLSDGGFSPISHFNMVEGAMILKVSHETVIRHELQRAGLVS